MMHNLFRHPHDNSFGYEKQRNLGARATLPTEECAEKSAETGTRWDMTELAALEMR